MNECTEASETVMNLDQILVRILERFFYELFIDPEYNLRNLLQL